MRNPPLFAAFLPPDARLPGELLEAALRAEELGLDMISFQDHPYNGFFFDTWTLLSYLAGATRRVRLMTNVANLPLRHPPLLAKAAATLDILSGGRLELGLGAGAFWRAIQAYGGPARTPREAVEALEEAIRVIRLIWHGGEPSGRVSFEGRHYRLLGAHPGPRPAHNIRIWIGGYGPRMLGLTGRLAEGWTITLPYVRLEELPRMQERIDRAAERAGRRPEEIRRNITIPGLIAHEGEASGAGFAGDGTFRGPPEAWAELLASLYLEGGFDTLTFAPVGGMLEQLRLFAERVVPGAKRRLLSEGP